EPAAGVAHGLRLLVHPADFSVGPHDAMLDVVRLLAALGGGERVTDDVAIGGVHALDERVGGLLELSGGDAEDAMRLRRPVKSAGIGELHDPAPDAGDLLDLLEDQEARACRVERRLEPRDDPVGRTIGHRALSMPSGESSAAAGWARFRRCSEYSAKPTRRACA